MKNIQNTLGAMVIFAGILAGSTFAQETQKVQSTTQNAVVTALATKDDTNNAGKIVQVSTTVPKILDISVLEFKKLGDTEKLVREAKRLGLEVKEKIDDEKKFEVLKKQIDPLTEEEIKALKFENKEDVETLKKEMVRYGIGGEITKRTQFTLFKKDIVIEKIKVERAIIQEEGREAAKRAEIAEAEGERLVQEANGRIAKIKESLQKEVKKDINKK